MPRWIVVLALVLGLIAVALTVAAGGTQGLGGGANARGAAAAGSVVTAAVLLWGRWRS